MQRLHLSKELHKLDVVLAWYDTLEVHARLLLYRLGSV